ncbi:MAG: hypothetical protein JWM41_678 [Gemmatimonadetes bacterium]|nr:hypothetical protein [Gemmatimonadota bacterium]
MRLDRKLLLIAPTIVLFFVVAGMLYAALQLHVLTTVSDSMKERSAFIGAVERGEKTLNPRQSAGLLRLGLDVEAKRTAALTASRDLLVALAAMAFVACCALAMGIRAVPREHWPRVTFGRAAPE